MIFLCKSIDSFVFMLIYPSMQIICYTNVHHGISFVRKYVNVIHRAPFSEIPPSRCLALFRLCHLERSRNPSEARIKRCVASIGISDEKVRFRFASLRMTRADVYYFFFKQMTASTCPVLGNISTALILVGT